MWKQLILAGIKGSSFANLCIKPGALVAGGLRLIHWVDEKLNRGCLQAEEFSYHCWLALGIQGLI